MPILISLIFKFVDSPKTQKIKHLGKQSLIFLQIKKLIHYTLRAII